MHTMHDYAMTSKSRRHALIRELLTRRAVGNQRELEAALREAGADATQATVSRDLRELEVLKGPEGYVLPDAPRAARALGTDHLRRSLPPLVRDSLPAGNLVVLKTGPGQAPALALELDRTPLRGVLGTVAGDDTVFVATDSDRSASRLAREIMDLASSRGSDNATPAQEL
jgi:transcriptional regulator of arginine metabolism